MNNNDAIIQRIKGIPAQKETLASKFDPCNPNLSTNDNSPPVLIASHNSGEGDPSVMLGCAGGDTSVSPAERGTP